jgi:hypothetical protein
LYQGFTYKTTCDLALCGAAFRLSGKFREEQQRGSFMFVFTSLLAVLIAAATRLALMRSKYFQELAKDLPPMPPGL